MKTESILVPHFEGYKCVGYKVPKLGQYYCKDGFLVEANNFHTLEWLVYEKILPKRYVFEETGEFRQVLNREWYLNAPEIPSLWLCREPSYFQSKILRKVDE